jgi:hypothetical protein
MPLQVFSFQVGNERSYMKKLMKTQQPSPYGLDEEKK